MYNKLHEILMTIDILFPPDDKIAKWPKEAQDAIYHNQSLFIGMMLGSLMTTEQIKRVIEKINKEKK